MKKGLNLLFPRVRWSADGHAARLGLRAGWLQTTTGLFCCCFYFKNIFPRSNPRVSCRGGRILKMDLRAWMETEVKPPIFHSVMAEQMSSVMETQKTAYQSLIEEAHQVLDKRREQFEDLVGELPSMPLLQPDGDSLDELPQPIVEVDQQPRVEQRARGGDESLQQIYSSAYRGKLFYK